MNLRNNKTQMIEHRCVYWTCMIILHLGHRVSGSEERNRSKENVLSREKTVIFIAASFLLLLTR